MKDINQWFEEYSASHRNKRNIAIHKVAVPIILFATIGIIAKIPLGGAFINVCSFSLLLAGGFYIYLEIKLGMVMILVLALIYTIQSLIHSESSQLALYLNIGLFFIAWIMQFYGHKIEGKRPKFFQDITFLLIGPIWTANKILKWVDPTCSKEKEGATIE